MTYVSYHIAFAINHTIVNTALLSSYNQNITIHISFDFSPMNPSLRQEPSVVDNTKQQHILGSKIEPVDNNYLTRMNPKKIAKSWIATPWSCSQNTSIFVRFTSKVSISLRSFLWGWAHTHCWLMIPHERVKQHLRRLHAWWMISTRQNLIEMSLSSIKMGMTWEF